MPFVLFAQSNNDNAVAMQYYQDGEYEKAAIIMEKIFSKTSNEAYFDLYFNALMKSKQYDSAEKLTKKLIKQSPGIFKYEIALGRVYKEKGEQDNATKTFSHVTDNLPADEFNIRDLANYLYQIEEYDMAIEVFLKGRKVINNEQLFTYELLSLYRFKKDKNRLIQEYINALSTMPQLLPQAEAVFSSMFDSNADYLTLQNALFKRIQKDPQNEAYTNLLTWQFLQQEEYEMALRQLIAQDKRLKEDGAMVFKTAQTFIANKAYDTAIEAYTYLLSKGKENEYYLSAKLAMIDTQYQILLMGKTEAADISLLANQYKSILDEYGSNPRTLFALRKLATIQAYYLHNLDKAQETLEAALNIQGLSSMEIGEIKLDLGDIYVLNLQPWEAILLYEQVTKSFENQNIGNEARFRAARLSFYQGNFSYAKSQADILKASTDQLIANDALNLSLLLSESLKSTVDTLALKIYAEAELLQFKNLSAPAIAKLDSITVLYPHNNLTDDILMSKSKIHIKNKDFTLAASLLNQLITHPQQNRLTDDALFMLASLYQEQLNEPEQAKILYQKLIIDYPGSMYVANARKRFRKLRGDNIGS